MSLKVEIRGLAEIKAKLRKLADPTLTRNVLLRIGQWAQGALQGKPYPPERTGQTYRRTGQLNRAWATLVRGTWSIVIRNPASGPGGYYAEGVVGEDQWGVHDGRWWKAKDVVEETIPKALPEAEAYIEAIWNS